MEIPIKIKRVIKETRGEPGLSLRNTAQAIATDLKNSEIRVLINELLQVMKERKGLDQFIDYAIEESYLDGDLAQEMSYKEKRSYFNKCEVENNES